MKVWDLGSLGFGGHGPNAPRKASFFLANLLFLRQFLVRPSEKVDGLGLRFARAPFSVT